MNEVLACRGCRRELNSDAGCAICLPIKPHLIVASAVDEDAVPLATVATEAVSLLRKQLTQLKLAQKRATTYDHVVANETRSVANTLAKLLDSARKVVQDGADAVSAMSFPERKALFLEWTGSLPGAFRRRIIEDLLAQNEAKQEPLNSTVSDNSDTNADTAN